MNMVRLNLQLFGKDYTKVVNEVIRGNYGNGTARVNNLKSAGYNDAQIKEIQNLVNAKYGISSTKTTTTTTTNKNTNTNKTTTTPAPKGWSQENWDGANSSLDTSKSDALKGEAESTYNDAKEFLNKDSIIDQSVKDTLGQKFEISESTLQAMNLLKQQGEALQSGKTSWTDQLNEAMNKYLNREKFEYDVDNDQLFQQALASAMGSGKTAMQDTIGQASALTGGYGSTYATSAGNQAYNSFIEDAYANLPQYYQMALEAYQMEGQEMYNQVAMLGEADAQEYQKMINAYNVSADNVDRMYGMELDTWNANQTQAVNLGNMQLSEYGQIANNKIALNEMAQNRYETEYQREFKEWEAMVNQYMQLGSAEQSSYWSQQDLQYKKDSLAEEKRQFNLSRGDTNNDGVISDDEKKAIAGNDLKQASSPQKQKALDAYNSGGTAGLNQYLNSLPDDVDKNDIATYVGQYGNDVWDIYDAEFTKSEDTYNNLWGWITQDHSYGDGKDVDWNDKVKYTDGSGTTVELTLRQLEKKLKDAGVSDDLINAKLMELTKKRANPPSK